MSSKFTLNKAKMRAVGEATAFAYAQQLKNEATQILESAGTGPSKAGDAPAPRTGRLKGSLRVTRLSAGKYRVFSTAPYAAFLEYGTRKMEARPFFRPAVERVVSAPPDMSKVKSALKSIWETIQDTPDTEAGGGIPEGGEGVPPEENQRLILPSK